MCARSRGPAGPAGPVRRVPFGGVSWPADQFPMGRSADLLPGLFKSWIILPFPKLAVSPWRDLGAACVSPSFALSHQSRLRVVSGGWGAPSPRFCASEPERFPTATEGVFLRPELPGAGSQNLGVNFVSVWIFMETVSPRHASCGSALPPLPLFLCLNG